MVPSRPSRNTLIAPARRFSSSGTTTVNIGVGDPGSFS
jgi:hypothetical protein